MGARAASRLCSGLLLVLGCDRTQGSADAETGARAQTEAGSAAAQGSDGHSDSASALAPKTAVTPEAAEAPAAAKAPEAPALSDPIESRRALSAMMTYADPSFAAPFRGKVARRDVFAVYGHEPGDEHCDNGWGLVAVAGYACLDDTEVVEAEPEPLPQLLPGEVTPFYWARLKKKPSADAKNPPAPIWRSYRALRAGQEPIAELEPARDYAFVRRRRRRGGSFLSDATHRTVKEADVERHKPSTFAGRDLLAEPIPEGRRLAWSVTWPSAVVRDEPRVDDQPREGVAFHTVFFAAAGAPGTHEHRGTTFVRVTDEGTHAGKWVEAKQVRRYLPAEPLAGVGESEIWLDVDLDQQTLTIWRGTTPEFVTLISSGNWKNPTPKGIYRLISKQAYGDMRSRPDEEEPYWVESVPWVLYFDGRYALHGTFWHNRFGRRTSHGCVNMAPLDAARVFGVTKPVLPGGWMNVYEHEAALGTTLRIREGTEEVVDRRGDVIERTVTH